MSNKNKSFDVLVIISVTLVGAGFGVWAGLLYGNAKTSPFGVAAIFGIAAISGAIGGYLVAKLYLCSLAKMLAKGYRKFVIWLLGTIIAALCGVLCTTFLHAMLLVAVIIMTEETLTTIFHPGEMEGLALLVFAIAELIGAVAGLIAGAICSLIFVLSLKGKSNETA